MDQRGTTGATADAIELLVADHRNVEQLLEQVLQTKAGDTDLRQELGCRLVGEIMMHAAAEEEILYPAMRDVLPDGDALADDGIEEHQEVERLLTEIERTDVDDARFLELWREVQQKIAHHVEDEEQKDFPQLREHVREDRLTTMGRRLAEAKDSAPAHPHPHAPSTPPANKIGNAAAAAVDRFRDVLTRA